MKLSTRARYGTRLMIELAANYGHGPAYLSEIARGQDISEKYLGQIVIPLKARGFIKTSRGAYGGYELNKSPKEITLKEIVDILEGETGIVDCTRNKASCGRAEFCVTRDVWCGLEQRISDYLSSITLESMVKMRSAKLSEEFNYNI